MFWFPKKKSKKVLQSVHTPESDFAHLRKKLLWSSIISLSITFASLAIVGVKFFYPFHMVIGVTLYVVSFIPIIRRIYQSRKIWQKYHYYKFSRKFFRKEKIRLIFLALFLIASVVFLWLRPLDEKPFKNFSDTEIQTIVTDDVYTSVTAMDYLETSGNDLLETLDTTKEDINTTEDIVAHFNDFLVAVEFSESLTEKHRYFSSIPYRLWNERISSFLISYSLYVKKYEMVHRIITAITGDEYKKKALNQYMEQMDRDGVYNEMVLRSYSPKTSIRLGVGALYMKIFASPRSTKGSALTMLYEKASGSYGYIFSNILTTVSHSAEVLTDGVENKMFDTWFPIQKGIANTMGKAILTTRGKDGFITTKQSLRMQESMLPGDIMLQRRNWHVSNVGIPGFWTHAALYTGELSEMDEYFQSEFPYMGYETFSDYMKVEYPKVYTLYSEKDKNGYERSVVEAIDPEVLVQSIVKSTDADFIVVLRPSKLSKKDIMLALFKAFEDVGKPYDYNFDFDTIDEILCSELVYNSYFPKLPEKEGLHFVTSIVSGRKMVSPLDIAQKFTNEYGTPDAELSFVYFLWGNADPIYAREATVKDFMNSLTWSKFSFFQ